MTDVDAPQHTDMNAIVSNAFGEQSLFAINHNVFQDTDASTVFRSYFGDEMFENDMFYVIAGVDSGLLYQYVKAHGVPKGSRYLFVELPEILDLLVDLGPDTKEAAHAELATATGENWLNIATAMGAKNYAALERITFLRSLGATHNHYKNYDPFWRKLKTEFDAFAWEQKTAIGNRPYFICQIENLTENQTPAILLKDSFKGKTAVLLAGGPSLDDLLPWVKKHRDNLLVIAVTRVSRTLLNADIQPDICVSIDPLPSNLVVSRDVFKFKEGTLLVNDFHIYPTLLSSWGGKKMYIGPRYPWPTPLQPENMAPTKGTTVANTALDIAVATGVSQVVLCGVDFCFSQEGFSYSSGSPEYDTGPRLQPYEQRVKTNNGLMADTLNAYAASAASVDELAINALSKGCRFINPAPGAMQLPHVEHTLADDINIEPMQQRAHLTLENVAPSTDEKTRSKLYKEVLGEIDRVLKELGAISELSKKALVYNRKLFAKNETDAGYHNKEKVERIEEQLNTKHAHLSTFIRTYGATYFTPIKFLNDDLYAEDLEQSCKLYHQAFVTTCNELIEHLRQARTRTTSRLEEEKPKANIQRLLEQWTNDEQPGRAIQWTELHDKYVNRLPDKQKNALHSFQNTFEATVDKFGEQYYPDRGDKDTVNMVADWGQEYFQSQDKEKLSYLLTSLQNQRDQEKVSHLTPLIQGYLAEIENKPAEAINTYQKVTEGTAHTNALLRLFALHSEKQDYDSAVEILKTLSDINGTYTPMYADMLQSTGNIEDAVTIYTDYLLSNPDDLNTMMKLGKLFLQCGSADGVTWTMNYILGKDPDNKTAKQILSETDSLPEPESTKP